MLMILCMLFVFSCLLAIYNCGSGGGSRRKRSLLTQADYIPEFKSRYQQIEVYFDMFELVLGDTTW